MFPPFSVFPASIVTRTARNSKFQQLASLRYAPALSARYEPPGFTQVAVQPERSNGGIQEDDHGQEQDYVNGCQPSLPSQKTAEIFERHADPRQKPVHVVPWIR